MEKDIYIPFTAAQYAEGLELQAILVKCKECIDDLFGEGYSKTNPALVGSMFQGILHSYDNTQLLQHLSTINKTIEWVGEKIQHHAYVCAKHL
jgi:hypothetical protein